MGKEKKNDLTIKILALIIAIILWSYVMSEVDPVTKDNMNVDVNFLNVASLERQGLVVLEPENASVRVQISGRRSQIIKVSEKDIIAQVDLSGYSEGKLKVPVYVQAPSFVNIEDYNPKEILVTFDKIITKEIPITVETTGEVPTGNVIGTPEARPQYIVVEGPRTWLNSVSKVVATLDVSKSNDDINVPVPIRIVDDEGNDVRGVSSNLNVVDVFIPVYKVKTVPIELRTENELPENYEIVDITIKPSTVSIVGKKDVLQNITQINTVPVDILTLMNSKDVLVDLDLPDGVTLRNLEEPVKVTLNIEEILSKTFEYTLQDVEIKNINPGLKIAEDDMNKAFTVTVQGISSVIEALDPEDIELMLDLSELGEGIHNVQIAVEEKDFKVIQVQPETLDIRLVKI
ncbi:MAG TPA: hypothetical protein GXX53_06370 [Tissierellia bacterium]|nr:hypothetical protein [Tissierellia bacterium]